MKKLLLLTAIIFGVVCLPSPNSSKASACDSMCAASYKAEKKEAAASVQSADMDETYNSIRTFPFSFIN
ncbi:MAG: hypothetical protein WDM90_12290 [Ferruginibacter sp.]